MIHLDGSDPSRYHERSLLGSVERGPPVRAGARRLSRGAHQDPLRASCPCARVDPVATLASTLHHQVTMTAMRKLGALVLVLGGVLVALSPRRRALVAQKLAQARGFLSRGGVDRDARDNEARARWDDDGGATKEPSNAALR